MEIVIHGTKGGYKVLHQTIGAPSSVARDMRRPDGAVPNTVGQTAYGLSLLPGGCAFTKYVIVIDADKYAYGNVAISLYISDKRKLAGVHIRNLLDKMMNEYVKRYIVDGTLGKHLDNGAVFYTPEEWAVFDKMVASYESEAVMRSPDDIPEQNPSGTQDPAFIYYDSPEELQRFFDAPYQLEYAPFRQIYFIDQRLRTTPENPLGALRHTPTADLTGHIDLDNVKMTLKDFNGNGRDGVKITVSSNGQLLRNGSKFYSRVPITIQYEKNQFYDTVTVSGVVTDENVLEFITVDEANKVTVRTDVTLHKLLLRMPILLRNRMDDVYLMCLDDPKMPRIPFDRSEVEFEGEELGYRWSLATGNGKFRSVSFRPIDYLGQTIPSVSLELLESKTVTFKVEDEEGNNRSLDCKLQIEYDGNLIPVNNAAHEFVGAELQRRYILRVTCSGYKAYSASFSPSEAGNVAVVKLTRASVMPAPEDPANPFVDEYVTPKPMWPKLLVILSIVVLVVGGLVGAGIYFFGKVDQSVPIIKQEKVSNYLDGNDLRVVMLRAYKDSCTIAFGELETAEEQQAYKALQERLVIAVKWREALDTANLDSVLTNYFPLDSSLYYSIKSIKNDKKSVVVEAMRDPMSGLADRSLPEVDSLIVNVQRFVDVKRAYEKKVKANAEPVAQPANGRNATANADAAETAKESEQKFCRDALDALNALNIPELEMVVEFRRTLAERLGELPADKVDAPAATPTEPANPVVPATQPQAPKTQTQPAKPQTTATTKPSYTTYTIQKGDQIGKIAAKYGLKSKDVMEANGFTEDDAKRLQIGQKIKIPRK